MRLTESDFEEHIEEHLLTHGGYTKGNKKYYDKKNAIDMNALMSFIELTQPEIWKKYKKRYKGQLKERLYQSFNKSVEEHGLLHVLRHGLNERGTTIRVAYFKPETGLNKKVIERYEANKLEVTRQFYYSAENNKSIDMVISLNGIPIVALELKNQLTGQSVDDAKVQWMHDRDPREKCFQFNSRFLVYFAVDLYDVYMTTHLQGRDTLFLPFNQGSGGAGNVGGAGNPEGTTSAATSYLWERVLEKDMLMELIQRYLHLDGNRLIFPRYQQLDVVTKLVDKVKNEGSGHNYLVQHSAGSGKSNSIAWLAYRLSNLHNESNESVFSSVIVISDRRVLDRQLQDTISSFDHTPGVVETIGKNKTSQDLRDAINNKKKIIITTIQKFPYIYDELDAVADRNFAIIIDEAHQSQSGSTAKLMQEGLMNTEEALNKYATRTENAEEEASIIEEKMLEELASHGRHKNISRFAFTATPKRKTLELFGEQRADGSYQAHHIYSMRQAIEEGFILDVLSNYMTYQTSYQIASAVADNSEVPTTKAIRKIQQFASLHPTHLKQKAEVIVEQFRNVTQGKINGEGKAMVMASSREQALLLYKEINSYIERMNYDNPKLLIAFSGKIFYKDEEYTEDKINARKDGTNIREDQLPAEFASDEYNMLIVADKYQTGFDEPKLHTLFINKRLREVRAVQALSRANRTHPGKIDTFVLDFVNTKEEIEEAFAPYYESTILDEGINPRIIYNTRDSLRRLAIYGDLDVEKFIKLLYIEKPNTAGRIRMTNTLKPITERYNKLDEDEQVEFKRMAHNLVKWYQYITQLTRLYDKEMHKEYLFLSCLVKLLPSTQSKDLDLEGKLKLEYFKLTETFQGNISGHEGENKPLESPKSASSAKKQKTHDTLDNIIEKVNKRMSGAINEENKNVAEELYHDIIKSSNDLESYAKINDEETFISEVYSKVFENVAMRFVRSFDKLHKDGEFYNLIKETMARETYRELRNKSPK